MALESETVETLESRSLANACNRARLVDPLIVTLDAHQNSRMLGQRKSNAGKPKPKMELLLYCLF